MEQKASQARSRKACPSPIRPTTASYASTLLPTSTPPPASEHPGVGLEGRLWRGLQQLSLLALLIAATRLLAAARPPAVLHRLLPAAAASALRHGATRAPRRRRLAA